MATTTKRKRVSKKSKQSWRKHTDIKDVEEHLEEARREERTGGPVSEKPDEGLYFVDKKTEEIKTTAGKPKERSRKRKLLKTDQLLLPESKIEPIGSKKRIVHGKNRQVENSSNSSDSEVEEEKGKLVSAKTKHNKSNTAAVFDLWETQDIPTGDGHFLTTTKRSKVKKPKSINRKTSELAAVEVCSPGASYNPTYEDHQSLLQTAHDVELRKVKEIEKLKRQVKFLTAEEAANLPTWSEEMSQGLFDEDSKEVDEAESDEVNEGAPVAPVRAVNRKTKQQRRKEKEKEEEQKRLETEKKEKMRQNEIFRVKTLKKEIKMADDEAEKKKKRREEIKTSSATKPKTLSKYKYESPNVEIQLGGELTGNLRTLKQEGNLFEDRFRSLQRRNIIETRLPVKPFRKYKQKTYTRKSYEKPCIKEI